MSDPRSKEEVLSSLKIGVEEVHAALLELSVKECFQKDGERWSAAENLQHLILSVVPLAKGLEMPKLTLRMMFGKSASDSRSFSNIIVVYKELLEKGAVATNRYVPDEIPQTEEAKADLLHNWQRAGKRLLAAAEAWSEQDMDVYQLPHPLIGKMTVREMLFFTIYHNAFHGKRISEAAG